MTEKNTKKDVRQFYDQVGWSQEEDGNYQNARYEDLRPVSREYIHKTRMRVNDHLPPFGRFLLDAGSGPVQYPEYLTYSKEYQYRVCADISITALQEAKKRLGTHALPVVVDVANLPFAPSVFDGLVSMHTIHHLPMDEHRQAYIEFFRVLKTGGSAVVVNGWGDPLLMRIARPFIRLVKFIRFRLRGKEFSLIKKKKTAQEADVGTFIRKTSAIWLKEELKDLTPIEIFAWRSVNTHFLRTFIHAALGGKFFLKILFWKEDVFTRFFGKHGQYPMVVFKKK
ncbi:MAG: class I SAM-dependent methyltransferase [Anaerolineae bacterium]|jgi:ubiquinone/menaquinone biosynthesis C-methylase UbiE|nr:class I SAM-dependent methyltransferase [Anaerolineae bacterium]MBT7782290.1 class I SAM-dependent methyltransferase [Anaerolineae bacterium]